MNAIVPASFLVLIAVLFFVVVAALMSGRNRGLLGDLAAVVGFGVVGLVGVFLLLGLLYLYRGGRFEIAEEGATEVWGHAPVEQSAGVQENLQGKLAPSFQPPKPPAPPETPKTVIEVPQAEAEQVSAADSPVTGAATSSRAGDTGPAAEGAATGSPTARPQWMDEPQGKHGSDGAYRKIASVELYHSRLECEQALPAELRKAVEEYIDQFLGEEGAGKLVALPMPYIHDRVVKDEWEEHALGTYGTIINLHKLLVFDGKVNTEIKAHYQRARVAGRLTTTGVGAGLLLGLLGMVFGYLKLDTLTRGYYSRRLQFAAGSAILGLAAIAALLAKGMLGH